MTLKESIIKSIKQYGVSCSLTLNDSTSIPFKAIICHPTTSLSPFSSDLLSSDPSSPQLSTLITSDPSVLSHLAPNLTIKTPISDFQILQCKKYMLCDQLYYISSLISPL